MSEFKVKITSLSEEELTQYIRGLGQPAFRAGQIFRWLHQRGAVRFSAMTDIPKALIAQLDGQCEIESLAVERKQVSKDGTVKYLFRLPDGNCIESVVMRYHYGNTICVSSEVGCRMGCRFCASTQNGLARVLTAGEIAAQVYAAAADLDERISHIVLMGIGEPLDNYDNVLKFLRLISSPNGAGIGMRNISLSTCGLVPQIGRLAQEKLGLTLSISLHAPTDALRSSMMPVNDAYPLAQLIPACRAYQKTTGRRISFEYSMVKGVNDSPECARQLAQLLRGMGAHVNLIPINPVDSSPYTASDAANVERFKELLGRLGLNATVRRRLGTDISAACGQLRQEEAGRRG
ncbi:23S rRNA (adenine(2503)-C(2))-methyltransferase RlmN [Anaerofilum sp. BX8]|uniref:Probable dual-specificity RNA methyltransferase RlmN n=1 Tax=Anaerofilum hominis TaxID=2763016 RepID=A0A923I994_9FIRM|nr:23S rRNA (adenine(2503)-C(2))-methyltransferase RlmN [Anaerofilum hominis]MBC5582214.1 23S rRNA (adenine(2503)-C(2))-methyltransferase RlmN [Anaerofilum hominis]